MNSTNPLQDQKKWFKKNKKFFSREMNGYNKTPNNSYLSTLTLINSDGDILDIGSGNGMLLKYLIEFSGHTLNPYGIDCNLNAIINAQIEILPQFAEQFTHSGLARYKFTKQFNIIIASPNHIEQKEKRIEYIEKYLNALTPNGRLILRFQSDYLKKENLWGKNYPETIKNIEAIDYCIKPELTHGTVHRHAALGYNIAFMVFDVDKHK